MIYMNEGSFFALPFLNCIRCEVCYSGAFALTAINTHTTVAGRTNDPPTGHRIEIIAPRHSSLLSREESKVLPFFRQNTILMQATKGNDPKIWIGKCKDALKADHTYFIHQCTQYCVLLCFYKTAWTLMACKVNAGPRGQRSS